MATHRRSTLTTADKIGLGAALFWLAVLVLVGVGWVMNVIKLIGMLGGDINAMFAARCVGVFFPPLASVLGWF